MAGGRDAAGARKQFWTLVYRGFGHVVDTFDISLPRLDAFRVHIERAADRWKSDGLNRQFAPRR